MAFVTECGGMEAFHAKNEAAEAKERLAETKKALENMQADLQHARHATERVQKAMDEMEKRHKQEAAALAAQLAEKDALMTDLFHRFTQIEAEMKKKNEQLAAAGDLFHSLFRDFELAKGQIDGVITGSSNSLGMPAVYSAHNLDPLCIHKVEQATAVWMKFLHKTGAAFRLAAPKLDELMPQGL